jgi:uncharacterized membrane protein
MQLFEYLFLPFGIVILLLIVAIPIIVIYLFLRLSETALEMVGFDHWHASLAVFGSIIGSLVDIPLGAVPLTAYPAWYLALVSLSPEEIPTVFHPVMLAVNLGGCIIPLVISAHLLLREKASPGKALIGIAVVAVVTYYFAEAIPGEGIVLPFWLSPLLAAICGLVLAGGYRGAPPLAYISGTVGTLIGADLLSLLTPGVLPALSYVGLQETGPLVLSIGGAGVFDGIFLTGIMSVLLAAGIVCLLRGSCDDLGAQEAKD